jgi:hypothetical protein
VDCELLNSVTRFRGIGLSRCGFSWPRYYQGSPI